MQNTSHWTRRAMPGMSLIEISLVVAIIGVFLFMAVRLGTSMMTGAKVDSTKTTLRIVKMAIDKYAMETNGAYPQMLEDLIRKPASGGAALRWQGPYVTDAQMLKDGWGRDLVYMSTGDKKQPYRLYSYGRGGEGAPEEEYIELPQE
jgi:type II secretion system protein G